MKKRLLPTLMIALLVIAGTTGCGPTGETSPDAGADTEADGVAPDGSGPPMDEGCVPADELPKLTTAEVAGGHEFSESLHVA